MVGPPLDISRVKDAAQKLVDHYAKEALDRSKQIEKTSVVKSFARAVRLEVQRILDRDASRGD